MKEQAENLRKHVAFFKTGQAGVPTPPTLKIPTVPKPVPKGKIPSKLPNNSGGWEDF
jgi:hypothetical protein